MRKRGTEVNVLATECLTLPMPAYVRYWCLLPLRLIKTTGCGDPEGVQRKDSELLKQYVIHCTCQGCLRDERVVREETWVRLEAKYQKSWEWSALQFCKIGLLLRSMRQKFYASEIGTGPCSPSHLPCAVIYIFEEDIQKYIDIHTHNGCVFAEWDYKSWLWA